MRVPTDTELLDWLEDQAPPRGCDTRTWVARVSSRGRGFRLYATSNPSGHATPRKALLFAYGRSQRQAETEVEQ